MIVAIQGTRNFDDYSVFLRGMGSAMIHMEEGDKDLFLYTAGPHKTNSMTMEFANVSERSLKSRGIRVRVFKVPPSWIKENINQIDYFTYFSKPKEPASSLVDLAKAKDVEVAIYRY
jgi:hypothetical protein